MLSTLAWRALRRAGLAGSRTSRLALLTRLGRVASPAGGEVAVALTGDCGAGVMRRLDDRTPLRSAMAAQLWLRSVIRVGAVRVWRVPVRVITTLEMQRPARLT